MQGSARVGSDKEGYRRQSWLHRSEATPKKGDTRRWRDAIVMSLYPPKRPFAALPRNDALGQLRRFGVAAFLAQRAAAGATLVRAIRKSGSLQKCGCGHFRAADCARCVGGSRSSSISKSAPMTAKPSTMKPSM